MKRVRAPVQDVFEWLTSQNLKPFRGKWIVAYNQRILGQARTLKEALEQANLPEGVVPFVAQVPEEPRLAL